MSYFVLINSKMIGKINFFMAIIKYSKNITFVLKLTKLYNYYLFVILFTTRIHRERIR